MRKYTAIFTNKRKEVIKHFYEAKGHKEALEEAKKLEGWPNVVITDETHTGVPGYGYGGRCGRCRNGRRGSDAERAGC